MKTRKLIILLPVIALLSSCKMTDFNPFQEDGYVPVALQTESITRSLTTDESNTLEDNVLRIDDYITGQKVIAELRSYVYSYFGDNAPAGKETMDDAFSYVSTSKTYNNNVKVQQISEKEDLLNDYVDMTITAETTKWTYLPTAATFETRRSISTDGAAAIVTTYNSGAYNPATDYPTRFGYGVSSAISDTISAATFVGADAEDNIIVLIRESSISEFALSRNGLVLVSGNRVVELKLSLYEPEDSDVPLYLPIQQREYIDYRIITEIYHSNEVIKYLDEPIIITYQEETASWMTQDYGNYTLSDIPALSA